MNVLFMHQNFPGQFKFLAPALAKAGHNVVAMMQQNSPVEEWNGVKIVSYMPNRSTSLNIHPWVSDFETKVIRGEACFNVAKKINALGFRPDVVISHPGWGESIFIKEVWPSVRLGIYCEFFYHATGSDVGFDAEFPQEDPADNCRILLKNMNNLLHFNDADAGISPTKWQASTFPDSFRSKISIIHDGIDTQMLQPNPKISLKINNEIIFTKEDEVVTFVNRNLEPYRGYHIFMRALPKILKDRPNAKIMIVGGNGVSYGKRPANNQTWRDIFLREVIPKIDEAGRKRIFLLGQIPYDHFIPLLQLSSVHVYLTYPFVLSWSLLEAMSVGCAIVASGTPPVREVISHDVTGRLVDFFDVEGLAGEVIGLLSDKEARARLGAAARQFAQDNYDLTTVCLPEQMAWFERLAALRD